MMRLAIVSVLGLAFAGCKSEKVPTCAEMTDHLLSIVKIAYPGHGDMGAQGNRASEIAQCEARNVPPKERRCIMAAKSADAVAKCRAGAKGDGPARRDRTGAPTAPAQ